MEDSLQNLPGVAVDLKRPITDVEPTKIATEIKRVLVTLEKQISPNCKGAMLVQTIAGKYSSG